MYSIFFFFIKFEHCILFFIVLREREKVGGSAVLCPRRLAGADSRERKKTPQGKNSAASCPIQDFFLAGFRVFLFTPPYSIDLSQFGRYISRMGKRSSTSTETGSRGKAKAGSSITLSNGFIAVPLAVAGKSADVEHWIYVRKHTSSSAASTSKVEDLPSDRTLFIANLPVDATEDGVREWFGRVGGVSMVRISTQGGG